MRASYIAAVLIVGTLLCACQPRDVMQQLPASSPLVTELSEDEAAELAARLANEKCKAAFDRQPFRPESYEAQLLGSRWHWGEIEPAGIAGYSADVEFNGDGSQPVVRVAFHTDRIQPVTPDALQEIDIWPDPEGVIVDPDGP